MQSVPNGIPANPSAEGKKGRAPIKGKAFAVLAVVFGVLSVFMFARAGYGMEVQVVVHANIMGGMVVLEGTPVHIWASLDWSPNNRHIDDEAFTTIDADGEATATLTLTRPGEYTVFASAFEASASKILQVEEGDDGGTLEVWIDLMAFWW